MRTLFLLRGAPGSGKSTWVKNNNLEPYTLSADSIRLMYSGPVLNIYGRYEISQGNDGLVWKLLMKLLEGRMAKGEFVIVDATHYKSTLLNKYKNLIKKYRYRAYIVDFTKVPIEVALERNKTRDEFRFVPEEHIRKLYAVFEDDKEVSTRFNILTPEEAVEKLHENLLFDYNHYEKVVVFGDIHGCYEPLKNYFNDNPFNEKTAYIFVGDYVDRGIQNKEVLEFLIKLKDNKNVLLLEGNHERWIRLYANDKNSIVPIDDEFKKGLRKYVPEYKEIIYRLQGDKVRSDEFINHTVPQIKDIDVKDLKQLSSRFAQMAYISFGDSNYFVCHGGIPVVPSIFVSTEELIKGVGKYEFVQAVYSAWLEGDGLGYEGVSLHTKRTVLVHGHRNVFHLPPHVHENIYNLCSDIEFGEPLRILEIEKGEKENKETVKLYENTVFNPDAHRRRKEMEQIVTSTDNSLLEELNNSKLVTKKSLSDNIVSYNFSRNCFYKREWNELTCTARGLFVDVESDKVVARSYNKFFNWGEVEKTKSKNLVNLLKFPVKAYKKENGFLALISYNTKTDGLLVCSKSTNEGVYVEYIKEQINNLPKESVEKITNFVRESDCTLVCECVDVVHDPHIIKYDKSCLFLLDIVKNDLVFEKLPYSDLVEKGKELGLPVKELCFTFNTFDELYTFKKAQDVSYDIRYEGWVFEDENGFMVKYKTRFYGFWKYMRKVKEDILKGRAQKKYFVTEDEIRVFNLMNSLYESGELETMSIIDVEDMYYKQ